jgi:hypothetical protein
MTTKQVRRGVKLPRKQRSTSDSMTPKDVKHATSPLVEERIKRIQKCHRIGSEILKRYPDHAPRNKMQKLATKYGIPEGATRRYRQIADMFTQSALEELYDQFREKNFAFSVTHFFVLIGVQNKKTRTELQKKAVRHELNITQLRKLKLRNEHSTGPGGRRPDVVRLQTPEDLHAAINFEAGKWHRWLKHLLEKDRPIKPTLNKRLVELHCLVKKVQSLSRR